MFGLRSCPKHAWNGSNIHDIDIEDAIVNEYTTISCKDKGGDARGHTVKDWNWPNGPIVLEDGNVFFLDCA